MSTHTKRRNKRYTPRQASFNGGLSVINKIHAAAEDARPIDPHAMTDLGIAYWAAFHQMLHGQSREEDWTMIVVALNVALILCERGFGAEYTPYIIKAQTGAFITFQRAQGLGVWRFDGNTICAVREALEVHDEQVKLATKGELRDALIEVRRRVTEGHVFQEAA